MATLGTVYDATPAPRRPHDVLTPAITIPATPMVVVVVVVGRAARARSPPPSGPAGSVATTSQQVIAQVFDQATQRDPTHRRTWVVLVDGARHQLDQVRAEARRRGAHIHILVDSRPRP
jgi:hypothetical protein